MGHQRKPGAEAVVRGQPTHLPALIRWYLSDAGDDIPVRLHNRDTDDGGYPQWHGAFRAWLTSHPAHVDREGHIRSPFRFWLWQMASNSRTGRVAAEWLYHLAALRGDWIESSRLITPLTEDGEVMARIYAVATLQHFWRLMQTQPHRLVSKPKSEAQHVAEESA